MKQGTKVYDITSPQFGEGIIELFEDSLVQVNYPDLEETLFYTEKEALKLLAQIEI